MKNLLFILTIIFLFAACGSGDGNTPQRGTTAPPPLVRQQVDTQPVATFSQPVTSEMGRLNNWKFAVALYETSNTFTYRIEIQYAELTITDSLQLPNLGIAPKPALQKGTDEYSCIVGFMDQDSQFRDYKSITVTNGDVRIHTLKYYGRSKPQ